MIKNCTLVVKDYDEAIDFYCASCRFSKTEDEDRGNGKRWVVVKPPGAKQSDSGLLLAKAKGPEQVQAVGNQTGGRVAFFLEVEDFYVQYKHMKAAGVTFLEEPREESYATVVVFQDLYGTKWDLLQSK